MMVVVVAMMVVVVVVGDSSLDSELSFARARGERLIVGPTEPYVSLFFFLASHISFPLSPPLLLMAESPLLESVRGPRGLLLLPTID